MTNFEILKMRSTQKELSYVLFCLLCSDEITLFYSFWNLLIPKPSVEEVILSKIAYDILLVLQIYYFLELRAIGTWAHAELLKCGSWVSFKRKLTEKSNHKFVKFA